MSVNVFLPHVLVLSEDQANREIANGFLLDPDIKQRNIQLMPPSGGWEHVVKDFVALIPSMLKYPHRHVVLALDFDDHVKHRTQLVQNEIPLELRPRVFLLGTQSEPERLRVATGISLEAAGMALSGQCAANACGGLWLHPLLAHNQAEVARLMQTVRPIIF